jgi:hypothetical protein
MKDAKMRRKLSIALLIVAFSLSIPVKTAFATPTPPYVLVNETTKECYITILGDECSWCDPPQGWKVLGMAQSTSASSCPAGYAKIEQLKMDCRASKDRFCCTAYFAGDCEDLVINEAQRACAFVDDINSCILPSGWAKRPANLAPSNWRCPTAPSSYEWKDNLACLTTTATTLPMLGGNFAVQRYEFPLAIGILLVLLIGRVLVWVIRKRIRR